MRSLRLYPSDPRPHRAAPADAPAPARRRRGAWWKFAATSVVLASAFSLTPATGAADSGQVAPADAPAPSPGWTRMWSDDFTAAAGSPIASENWFHDIGHNYPGGPANWGTGEIAYHTDSTQNVYQDGSGNLAIRPLRDAAGNWTSGRIETQRTDFRPPPGGSVAVSARLQLPNGGQGYWPAFWMLGAPFRGNYHNWPGIGEIDIMENVNGQNLTHGVLHCDVAPGGACNEFNGIGNSYDLGAPGGQAGFHTYTMVWSDDPQELRWYVDGNHFHTVTPAQIGQDVWDRAFGSHGFFIILNVAIGGGWPGLPDGTTVSGSPLLVDYVTVDTHPDSGVTP
ncbi:glycoside hydrolase family 16 protein [Allonocardiopsis opalescens]|uniref:Beta-glucanase (GH16 family) n=1 Tax=Allonocardiopsis opalescens TaxID=1144618 RepID=A0A2T0PS67_9ACTN|nr:glycoside hydrolase family 16 protein [Allonocardiopsis opalescens]PRX91751.1 beta-glucanase (GH16 family) [Allonocardiopsis opalescens]